MRYGAGVVSWTKMELQNVDRKTRKLMILYGMLHPRGDVDRLYVPKEIGRRRLMGVEDFVWLEQNERLMEEVIPEGVLGSGKYQPPKEVKNRNGKKRFESWKSKPLHGQILRQTKDVRDKTSWNWTRKGNLKKETEGLTTAAQDQALRTNPVIGHFEM